MSFPEGIQPVQLTPEKPKEGEKHDSVDAVRESSQNINQTVSHTMSPTVRPIGTASPKEASPKSSPTSIGETESGCLSTPKEYGSSTGSTPVKPPAVSHFFNDMAETIALSFPYEKFAKAHECSVENVKRTLSATVLRPLASQEPEDSIPFINGAAYQQLSGSAEGRPTRLASPIQTTECRSETQSLSSKGEGHPVKPTLMNGMDIQGSYTPSPLKEQVTQDSCYRRGGIKEDSGKKRHLHEVHSTEPSSTVTPPPSENKDILPCSPSPKKQKIAHGCNPAKLAYGNPHENVVSRKSSTPASEARRHPHLFTHGIEWRPFTDANHPVRRRITIDPFGNYEHADESHGLNLDYLRLGSNQKLAATQAPDQRLGIGRRLSSQATILNPFQRVASMERLRAEEAERNQPEENTANEGQNEAPSLVDFDYA